MIDRGLLRKLLLIAAVLFFISAGAAVALGAPKFAGGLALGFFLGATPFLSWTWILSRGFATGRNRILAVVLLVGKVGLYAGALFVFVSRELVDPVGVMVGVTAVVFIGALGALLGGAPRPKEAV